MKGFEISGARRRLGLTQKDAAVLFGVSAPTLNAWELGKTSNPKEAADPSRDVEPKDARVGEKLENHIEFFHALADFRAASLLPPSEDDIDTVFATYSSVEGFEIKKGDILLLARVLDFPKNDALIYLVDNNGETAIVKSQRVGGIGTPVMVDKDGKIHGWDDSWDNYYKIVSFARRF